MTKRIFLLLGIIYSLSFGGKSMLAIGDTAPGFSLKDDGGTVYDLENYKDKNVVVLIFYPGDQTPVCTAQLCAIRDEYAVFSDNGAVVFGINPGSGKSHKKFSEKNKFQFPLLIDEKMKIAALYKAGGRMMNQRTVYVIGKDGRIVFAKRGKPEVSEILSSFAKNDTDTIKTDLQIK